MAADPHNIESFSDYHRDAFNSLVERLENATRHLLQRPGDKWERDNTAAAWRSEWVAARGDHWRGRAIVRQTDKGYQGGVVLYELGHDATVHWSGVRPELENARTDANEALKSWLTSRDKELASYGQSYRGNAKGHDQGMEHDR